MKVQGTVHKYGDHVDTDVIIPARYLNTPDHKELAAHCMEDIDKDFIHKVKPGDVMVAGVNFGCGSSREHAPIAIKASGISCVIAKTFARIFYRNAINIGLAILECPAASDGIRDGRAFSAEFLFSGSTIKTRCQGRAGDFTPCCFSEVPGLFRNHLPVDTAIIIATPPDKDGFYRRLQRG